jgi:hypothetical protein
MAGFFFRSLCVIGTRKGVNPAAGPVIRILIYAPRLPLAQEILQQPHQGMALSRRVPGTVMKHIIS